MNMHENQEANSLSKYQIKNLLEYHARIGIPLADTVELLLKQQGTGLEQVAMQYECEEQQLRNYLSGSIEVPDQVRSTLTRHLQVDPWQCLKINTYSDLQVPKCLLGSRNFQKWIRDVLAPVPAERHQTYLDFVQLEIDTCKKRGIPRWSTAHNMLYRIVKAGESSDANFDEIKMALEISNLVNGDHRYHRAHQNSNLPFQGTRLL